MTKYKEYVSKMIDENKEIFDKFRELHDRYALNQDELQEIFNKEGEKIVELLREYEDRLCRQTEKGGYSLFSGKLAEKFQDEVRKVFPYVDYIGLKVEKAVKETVANLGESFNLKKIKLS